MATMTGIMATMILSAMAAIPHEGNLSPHHSVAKI